MRNLMPMVIYGVTADVSIGKLFLAGVIPGLLMGLALMVMVSLVLGSITFASHFPF
jgi:TRAP-type C4-dicarboxylate transport system permease large subunit